MKLLCAVCVSLAVIGNVGNVASDPVDLFADARLAPQDVRMYVHIEDVQRLRANLERLPISKWAEALLTGGQFLQAWSHLAQLAGVNSSGLLDILMGDDLTFMVRNSGSEIQWVILTAVDDAKSERLLKRLKPRVHKARRGLSMYFLPEFKLLIARSEGGLMVICPQERPQLFYDVLKRLEDDRREKLSSLAESRAVTKFAHQLGGGQAGLYIKHDEPLGGWSVATLKFEGLKLHIQHHANFAQDAFSRPITKSEIDLSTLDKLKDHALMAFMEPNDIGVGMVEQFIQQTLGGEPFLNHGMRKCLGASRIFAIGETEGRLQEERVDLQLPTAAIIFELKDVETAEKLLDARMLRLSRQLNHKARGKFTIDIPNRRDFISGEPRCLDLGPMMEFMGGGFPVMDNIDLCWQVVEAEKGSYYVIATHNQLLMDTVLALESKNSTPPCRGKWANAGFAQGILISNHLESVARQANLFADPEDVEEFIATIQLISKLAFGMDNLTWKLKRPCRNQMYLEVDIDLTPPLSAKDQ